jgi:alginate O-acetyltransferase complex protein AlgJ
VKLTPLPRTNLPRFILGILSLLVVLATTGFAFRVLFPPRPQVKAAIEQISIAGRDGMGFFAEEFSGPFAVGDPLGNVSTFAAIQRALSSRGVALVIALVPIKSRIYEDRLPELLPETIATRYERIRSELERNDVQTPDINTYLLSHPARHSNMPLYYFADTHWTPQAAFDVGGFVAKEISQRINLDTVPIINFVKRIKPAQISGLKQLLEGAGDGDLIRLALPDKPTRKQLKPLTDVILTTLETNVGLLEDNPAPKIILTGTSYSVNDAFLNGLRYGLSRDVQLVARDGAWYGTMKDYLASRDYQTKPPRMIIWEYPERFLGLGFSLRDPPQMVADVLGWCANGIRPLQIKPVPSPLTSMAYQIQFDTPIAGLYMSMRVTAAPGSTVFVRNSDDKQKPSVFERVQVADASTIQIPLDQIAKAPTAKLLVRFHATNPDLLRPIQISDVRVCAAPAQK